MAEFQNCSQGCDSLSLPSAPRIMIQVKLLYFIASLLSFNCLIIGFHNNRGPWKVGWSNPHWWMNCTKVAVNKGSCLGRSFQTDGHYLGKMAPELGLVREAKVPIFSMSYMKMCKRVPRARQTKEGLCWRASQCCCCEQGVLRGGTWSFALFLVWSDASSSLDGLNHEQSAFVSSSQNSHRLPPWTININHY